MERSVDDVARELAAAHRKEDPSTTGVYFMRSGDDVIRLVEISPTVDSGGEVLPFRFGPDVEQVPTVPYPSVLILLSPEDWERVRRGELNLPDGWDVKKLVPIH